MKMTWQLIAVHGWGSDQHCWQSWQEPCEKRGWLLECFERGYGENSEKTPQWNSKYKHAQEHDQRVALVIANIVLIGVHIARFDH